MEYQETINESCCDHPRRVNASIDCEFAGTGIRFRHLPGNVCFSCRDIYVPHVTADEALSQAIANCLNADPSGITIIKSRPRTAGESEATGENFSPAYLDIALGQNGGLVIENIKGLWNWNTYEAILPDEGAELRERLLSLQSATGGRLVPSLVYDTPQHPRSVQVELTTRCNLTCGYCTHKDLKVQEDISMERLDELFNKIDFSKVDNVDFTGLGEPMMHNNLPEIIRRLKQRGSPASIRVVTNGTVLSRARIKELCDAGITSIAFSIDSMNPERFAKSRGGAKLQKVIDNLEALVAYRNEHELQALEIKIKTVLIDDPYHEAEALLQVSARLGIEMPHFSCLDSRGVAQENYHEPWMKDEWSATESPEFLLWAQNRWNELNTITRQHPPAQLSPADLEQGFIHPLLPPENLCRWAIDAVFISSSGDLLSCCEQMIDMPRQYRGSLLKKSLRELWQDELLWNYRLPLSAGVAPQACVGCTWAPAEAL